MSDQTPGNSKPVDDQASKDVAPEMISVARRWIVKAGLTAPVILTLRSKPLFGQDLKCSAWMSASYMSAGYIMSGRPNLGPMPEACKAVVSPQVVPPQ